MVDVRGGSILKTPQQSARIYLLIYIYIHPIYARSFSLLSNPYYLRRHSEIVYGSKLCTTLNEHYSHIEDVKGKEEVQ